MLDYRQMLAFVNVVEGKSFTHAAKALFMTQPAISWQIKSLEQELELQLLERKERNVVVTEAGRLFYIHAKRIVRQYEDAINEMEQFKGLEKGHLIIGASTIPGEYVLPTIIGEFKNKFPGATIAMQIADTGTIVEMLLANEIHLGITGAKIKEPKLAWHSFLQDELVLIISPKHPLAEKEVVSFEDLKEQDFIAREKSSGTWMVVRNKLKEMGLASGELNIIMEIGSTRAVITAVEAGLGLSWVSRLAVKDTLQLGLVKELQVEDLHIMRDLYLTYNKKKTLSPLAEEFTKYITGNN
jgi:DNA-binding transcriptional LysR family regulator